MVEPEGPESKQWMIVRSKRPKRTSHAEPAGIRSFSSPSPICSADSLLYGSHTEGAADRPMEVPDRCEKQRTRSGLTTDASKRSDICLRDQGRRWKNKNIEVRYMSTRSGSAKEARQEKAPAAGSIRFSTRFSTRSKEAPADLTHTSPYLTPTSILLHPLRALRAYDFHLQLL